MYTMYILVHVCSMFNRREHLAESHAYNKILGCISYTKHRIVCLIDVNMCIIYKHLAEIILNMSKISMCRSFGYIHQCRESQSDCTLQRMNCRLKKIKFRNYKFVLKAVKYMQYNDY